MQSSNAGAVFQNDSDAETLTDNGQVSDNRTPLFGKGKCAPVPLSLKASVSHKTTRAGTYTHGTTPQSNLESNGSTNLRNCKYPTTRNIENMRSKTPEESNNAAENMLIRVKAFLLEINVDIFLEERKGEDKPGSEPIPAVKYKSLSREDYLGRHKESKTVDDNKWDTVWQDNVNIGSKKAENRRDILDTLAKYQKKGTDILASST